MRLFFEDFTSAFMTFSLQMISQRHHSSLSLESNRQCAALFLRQCQFWMPILNSICLESRHHKRALRGEQILAHDMFCATKCATLHGVCVQEKSGVEEQEIT